MPMYRYECKEHGVFEELRKIDDREKDAKCPECDKDSKFVQSFTSAKPIFKCGGFYETTYKPRRSD